MSRHSNDDGKRGVSVDCEIIHETEKAWLLRVPRASDPSRTNDTWFPKSMSTAPIEEGDEEGCAECCTVFMPLWLAEKNNHVYEDLPEEEATEEE